jgi:hypothetical protein
VVVLWYHAGSPVLPVRWVLVRDPAARADPVALLSTNLALTPAAIVQYFVQRWQVEVTFAEARRHLGVETQRQWSDHAIARTTPVLFGLFSLVTLLANRLVRRGVLPFRQAAWYNKPLPTFSDALALVRVELWCARGFHISTTAMQMQKPARDLLTHLTEALCYAA